MNMNAHHKSDFAARVGIALTLLTLTATQSSCIKKKADGNNRSGSGPKTEAATDTPPQAGGLKMVDAMINAVESSLTDSGVPSAEVALVISAVKTSPGVLAIGTEAGLALTGDLTQIEKTAPTVIGAFVTALEKLTLKNENADSYLKAVVTSGLKFTGTIDLPEDRRSALAGDVSASAISKLSSSGIASEKVATALGAISNATIATMLEAKVPRDAADLSTRKISNLMTKAAGDLNLSDDILGDSMASIAKSGGEATSGWNLNDPTSPAAAMTQGMFEGLSASNAATEKRAKVFPRIAEGTTTALPKLVDPNALYNAVSRVSDRAMTSFMSGDGSTMDSSSLQAMIPTLVGGAVKGILNAGVQDADLAANNLAAAPLDAMIQNFEKTLGATASDQNSRANLVKNAIALSMEKVALNSTNTDLLAAIAPGIATKTLEMASGNLSRMGISTDAGNLNQTNITTLYQTVFQGAFAGLSTGNAAAKVLPNIVASTMDGAVKAVGSLKAASGTTSFVTADFITNIAGVASQEMASKFSAKLPAADLNIIFAAGTSQYLKGVQTLAAQSASLGSASELSANISAQSLATFSGVWNAAPTGMQDAANALSAKIGSSGTTLDAKVLASISGAVQNVVVNAAKNKGGGSLKICETEIPGTLSQADFETKLSSYSELAACTATASACPAPRTGAMYRYKWNIDSVGTTCMLIREMVISGAGAVACGAGEHFVYGLGCQKQSVSCSSGELYLYGVGCQAATFFCPMGQNFVDGSGCKTVTTNYACPAGSYWEPLNGCQPRTNNCSAGMVWISASGNCQATSNSDLASGCPTGFMVSAGTSACVPREQNLSCPAGSTWNGSSCAASTNTIAAACGAGSTWDPVRMVCGELLANANAVCPGGQTWSTTLKACVCSQTQIWDQVTHMCVAGSQTCDGGRVFNTTINQCTCGIGKFWDGAACVDNSGNANACINGGGIWIEATKICQCPVGMLWEISQNSCRTNSGPQLACSGAGGTWNATSVPPCVCSVGNSWNPATNTCQSDSVRNSACAASGGTWTTPTCVCASDKVLDPVLTTCITPVCPAGGHFNGQLCVPDQCAIDQSWSPLFKKCALRCPNSLIERWSTDSATPGCVANNCPTNAYWERDVNSCRPTCPFDQHFQPGTVGANGQCVLNNCLSDERWHHGQMKCVKVTPPCESLSHFNGNVCVPNGCTSPKTWTVPANLCQ